MRDEKAKLFNKYALTKVSGEPMDPKAKYFVLRYDHNSRDLYADHARNALSHYAHKSGNQDLLDDIELERQLELLELLEHLPI